MVIQTIKTKGLTAAKLSKLLGRSLYGYSKKTMNSYKRYINISKYK